jgi:basic amino acid/polyamine antiporter, APA family
MMVNDLVETSTPQKTGLARRLGLVTATALIVGEVIGVGIFLVPAGMVKSLGSPGWLLVVWLTMGAGAIGGALCYGALAARYPQAGGGYIYLKEAYGPRTAFLYGWLSLFVTDPGLTAMLATGLANYVKYLVPLSTWELRGVAVAAIMILAAVNMFGVSLGSWTLRALVALKLGLLGFLVVWGLARGRGDWTNLIPFWTQRPGSDALLLALVIGLRGAFIAFAGWWDVSKLAGEVRDPEYNLPRALILGVSIVTVVYIAVSVVFLYLVPPARIASDDTAFAALAGEALLGRAGGICFTFIVIVSVAGSLAAVLMAFPRVYYAMARDGLFFASVAAVDPRRGTPTRSIAIQAALATVLALSGTFDQILDYFMVPTMVFIALTVGAVFVLRRPSASAPALATPGFPFSPLSFLIPIVVLIVMAILHDPKRTSIGFFILLLGVPVSGWVLTRRRPVGETATTPSIS